MAKRKTELETVDASALAAELHALELAAQRVEFRRKRGGVGCLEFRFAFHHAQLLTDAKENYKGKLHIKSR